MIGNIGDLPYLVLIAVIVLIAGSQLPKIARNVGVAGKEFRKAQQEAEEDAEKERQAKAAKEAQAAQAAQAAQMVQPAPALIPPPSVQVSPAVQAAAVPQSAPVAAGAAPAGAAPAGDAAEGSITLTPSQLDALLKAREDQAKREATGGTN
jgi:Sec-independent protein translocase protein TatA